ncbi:hypothetical protein PBI_TEAMOCIL_5 [Microbacterium phage Teamocil]|uniref:DUF2786 domain-containing protein n=1 Tax=Microbacterium phage Teamocil TaxID=2656554 RepID=A0A649VWN1_9CAUD|nr:hypothetical protein QDA12_gp05 [Microbacterium phage Teamocil]QGJ88860.1 hypothetical protein PBI_GINA_5 [Microbacterium phage Gina]QGJ96957.1 hypothetical protein PBI_TEAMOCIL_5 [Microbacterium phage Teamocil]
MTEEKRDKKADTIAALLAKAESTTPEEAEALREHAYRLMEKYMIDQAIIDARRAKLGQASEQIVTRIIAFEGMYRRDMVTLGSQVVHALGSMRPLVSNGRLINRLHIVGFESDVAQAEVLIRSLEVQALLAVKDWWYGVRNTVQYAYSPDRDKVRARHTFVTAFGMGAAERIEANRNQVIHEAGTGTELVLVDRRAKVDDFVDGMGLRTSHSKRKYDPNAFVHGVAAGHQARTGERSVSMGRGLPSGKS